MEQRVFTVVRKRHIHNYRIPSAYKVGICFPFQIVEEVPAEPFDIRMDEIITQQ